SFLTQVFEMVKGTYSIIVDFRDRQISNDELAALKMQVTTAQSEIESELSILRSHLETLKTQVVLNTTSLDNAENLVSERENAVHLLERELDLKKVSATEEQLEIQRSNIRQMELQLEISQKGARDEDVRAQEASVQQARAEVSLATISRNMSIISTPIGGSVMSLKIDYGDYVNTGEVIALIANEGAIEVQTFIPETDTELLGTAGIQVRIQGSDAKGKVTLISPAVDTETKKVEVTVSLAEGYELLLIGQTVFLEFATQLSPDNRYVPISALKVTQDQSFVFTVNDQSEVQAISITVKSVRGDLVEVEGITDDQLIIPKVSGLREGEEVTIEEAKSSSFSLQSQPSQPSQPSQ
ncbi:MAG: HlyD family efflux transporter periplasmic adaptor subunit, partial [Candidatus Gracilibacteria bacterium]|nr:HlyD family efflux transporter periplasmic adaptor subunit [Candidatus Gracilibacteria bacterium]